MVLHGKIVVLKRSGGDGTEFPLSATCLFGRKPDCDIRIQLPQVSKEHCRIDMNENKEVILTNLSSVNPTCVNGQALQHSERLKHGDVITIVDRSFRFEYPPPPTPKKRLSVGGKAEVATTDPHLKDGTNIEHVQRSLEKTQELEPKEVSLLEDKEASPFSDLYQMIKQSLDVKTPRKSSVSVLQTPSSKFCTPKSQSSAKKDGTHKKVLMASAPAVDRDASLLVTPKSAKKRRSLQLPADPSAAHSQDSIPTPRCSPAPQKFTLSEAIDQVVTQSPKSPRRKSKETTSPVSKKCITSPAKIKTPSKATPKSSEQGKKSKKRKSGELAADLPTQDMKRKRVSFGGHLSPELFDKRLPPDSPLRKGAAPRRSLCLYKPKQSLLRRASVIGLFQECDNERHLERSPKVKSPSKAKSPTPKSPKSASPKPVASAKDSPSKRAVSPKCNTPSPGKKSPTPKKVSPKSPKPQSPKKSKSPSPGKKAASAKESSPKTVRTTPVQSPALRKPETPKDKKQSKSASITDQTPKGNSPGRTAIPLNSPDRTPKVQGRFFVTRAPTPPPVAVEEVAPPETPKIPLKRKSMKISEKKTPALKSATKIMRRKSGMRAPMKVMTSWADIVRYGKVKVQVGAATRACAVKKATRKKAGPKPQTPKRRLLGHVGTGHAASPATIVVGRAHRLRAAPCAGAPPKIVPNAAVLKRNMKMDEDLTGLSEMFKTPKNEKASSAKVSTRTPQADLGKSFNDPSVLNTPEETGEMVVSPMSVASTVKGRRYNSDAVQRMFNGEESLPSVIPALDMQHETSEQMTDKVTTPKMSKQKSSTPEGLTGVKRLMRTPKQKAEPIEDLRGKLLKTPKPPKSEQQECLSAVKCIMTTPKEDFKGEPSNTPSQKVQQAECLTGVKRIMQTPKVKPEPVEDLYGKLLRTPKQKIEHPECLSAIKMLMKTPEQLEVGITRGMKIHSQETVQQECLTGVKRIMKTPKEKNEPIDDIRGKLLQTPKRKMEQQECLTGVKRIMTTPKQKNEPVEDMVGVKRLMKTPKIKVPPVEENFGIKRLMRSPRLRGNAPVEDFEGLVELMKEPVEEEKDVSVDAVAPGTEGPGKKAEAAVVHAVRQRRGRAEKAPTHAEDKVAEIISEHTDDQASTAQPSEEMEQEKTYEPTNEMIQNKPLRGGKNKIPAETVRPEPIITAVEDAQPERSVPKMKPQRGRKAKIPSQPPQAEMESNSSVTDNLQEEPLALTRVARKGRQTKLAVETPQEPETAAMESEPVEPAPPEKAKRSRKVKTAEASNSDVSQVPTRGRRGRTAAKEEQEEAMPEPAKKMCRTQVNKQREDAPVVTAEETPLVTEPLRTGDLVCAAEEAVGVSEEVSATCFTDKPKRGGKAKSTTEATIAAAVEEAEQAPEDDSKVKPTRGRGKTAVRPGGSNAGPAKRSHRGTEGPGKKNEAAVVNTVRQRRGRAEKALTHAEDKVAEAVSERTDDQASTTQPSEEMGQDKTYEPTDEMVQNKPLRGRKNKIPVEAVQPEPIITAVEDAQPEQSVPKMKPQRGRKAKIPSQPPQAEMESNSSVTDNLQEEPLALTRVARKGRQTKLAVETPQEPETAAMESEPVEPAPPEKAKRSRKVKTAEASNSDVSQVPTRGRRGRTAAKEEQEEAMPEPAKKMCRTQVNKQREDAPVVTAEETPLVTEPLRTDDLVCAAEEAVGVSEEVSATCSTDKPKRGGKAKSTTEVTIAAAVEEAEQAPEDDSKVKPTRGRGKTAVRPGGSNAGPAKRSHRGTAVSVEEHADVDTRVDTKAVLVEPVRRGRRAAKAPECITAEAKEGNSTQESSNGSEDKEPSKRSVRWKAEFEVIEVTPLKLVRGRKMKSADENINENGKKPEKENVAGQAHPTKRTRRGEKASGVAEESAEMALEDKVQTPPKTRRGRSAKK